MRHMNAKMISVVLAAVLIPSTGLVAQDTPAPGTASAQAVKSEAELDLVGREIADALRAGKIEANSHGADIERVTLRLRRLVQHPIKVVIPVGTYFVSRGATQNMVAREERAVVLATNDWQTLSLAAACANLHKDIPGDDDRFDVRPAPSQAELKKLMPVLRAAHVPYAVEQAAVWIVSDNATYDELGTLVSSPFGLIGAATRVIKEYEAAMAMKLCDQAGIDITKLAIWGDRERIMHGLKHLPLKEWLTERGKR